MTVPKQENRVISRGALRRNVRAKRRQLSPKERRVAADGLARKIRREPQFWASQKIGCYVVNDGEIDPRRITKTAWSMGKQVYVPILNDPKTLVPSPCPRLSYSG